MKLFFAKSSLLLFTLSMILFFYYNEYYSESSLLDNHSLLNNYLSFETGIRYSKILVVLLFLYFLDLYFITLQNISNNEITKIDILIKNNINKIKKCKINISYNYILIFKIIEFIIMIYLTMQILYFASSQGVFYNEPLLVPNEIYGFSNYSLSILYVFFIIEIIITFLCKFNDKKTKSFFVNFIFIILFSSLIISIKTSIFDILTLNLYSLYFNKILMLFFILFLINFFINKDIKKTVINFIIPFLISSSIIPLFSYISCYDPVYLNAKEAKKVRHINVNGYDLKYRNHYLNFYDIYSTNEEYAIKTYMGHPFLFYNFNDDLLSYGATLKNDKDIIITYVNLLEKQFLSAVDNKEYYKKEIDKTNRMFYSNYFFLKFTNIRHQLTDFENYSKAISLLKNEHYQEAFDFSLKTHNSRQKNNKVGLFNTSEFFTLFIYLKEKQYIDFEINDIIFGKGFVSDAKSNILKRHINNIYVVKKENNKDYKEMINIVKWFH